MSYKEKNTDRYNQVKQERIERKLKIIEEIKSNIPISSIVSQFISLDRHLKGECPYCGAKKFSATDKKNLFKCFSCTEGGDSVKFYADRKNISNFDAALEIALNYGIISLDEYNKLSFNKGGEDVKQKDVKVKKIEIKPKEPTTPIASNKTINDVYSIFAKGYSLIGKPKLLDKHYDYLKNRGLTDKEIEDIGYFSMPDYTITSAFFKELKKNNLNPAGVPGLYKHPKFGDAFVTSKNPSAICIPIRDCNSQIIGIQKRFDEVLNEGTRYLWFTSVNQEKNGGTSIPVQAEAILPKTDHYMKTLFITEGHFKGRVIHNTFNHAPVLSTPGVTSWRVLLEPIKEIVKKYNTQHIYIAFDADMSENVNVLNAALEMCKGIEELGLNVEIKVALWLEELGKGLDDLIFNGFVKFIDKVDHKLFVERTSKIVDLVHNRFPSVLNITEEEKKNLKKERYLFTRMLFDALILSQTKLKDVSAIIQQHMIAN